MKRYFIALLIGGALFGAVYGTAASLGGLTTGSVGADSAAVPGCDTDGIQSSFSTFFNETTGSYEVNGVFLQGISPGCNNKLFEVVLTQGTTKIATGGPFFITVPGPGDGGATVGISPTVAVADVDGIHVLAKH